jgi:polyhydroxyalkanoate synthesis regulator phasin
MKIGNSNEASSILNLINQNASKSSRSQGSASNSAVLSPDSLTISEEAYQMMAARGMKPGEPPPQNDPSEALQNLVKDGTITEDQSTAIADALGSNDTETESPWQKLQSVLQSLIDNGTLTEEEATSVADTMMPPPPPEQMTEVMSATAEDRETETINPLTEALQRLVEDGTLTEDQSTAIADALGSNDTETESPWQKLQSVLQSLIDNGTLTEEEATSVADTMMPPPPPGRMMEAQSDTTAATEAETADAISL